MGLSNQRECADVIAPYFEPGGLVIRVLENAGSRPHIMDFTRLRVLTAMFSLVNKVRKYWFYINAVWKYLISFLYRVLPPSSNTTNFIRTSTWTMNSFPATWSIASSGPWCGDLEDPWVSPSVNPSVSFLLCYFLLLRIILCLILLRFVCSRSGQHPRAWTINCASSGLLCKFRWWKLASVQV